ncbi:MAG: TolC family protein [Inhella sp.]
MLAQARSTAAEQDCGALLGLAPDEPLPLAEAPEPEPAEDSSAHPLLAALAAKAQSAQRRRLGAGAIARQPRADPAADPRARRRGEASNGTLSLGLRIPLGGGRRQRAALASATAEQTEAEIALARAHERVQAQVLSARAALAAARAVLQAAAERARLAGETRAFFDKSFRLGETDLPTRLRVELEAAQAQREQARARIALHQAIAQLRQALGLLPQ